MNLQPVSNRLGLISGFFIVYSLHSLYQKYKVLCMRMLLRIFVMFVMISCQYRGTETIHTDHTIVFHEESMPSMAENIDTVMYLPLESHKDGYYSHVSKVVSCGDKIFIGDFVQHKIVVYDTVGRFLYALNRRGRAANEYLEIKSFCATENEISLIDNFSHTLKIYNSATGDFIRNHTMPFVAWDVEWMNGGYAFAFSPLQKDFNPNDERYRLFLTDKELNVVKKLFPYKKGSTDPIGKTVYFSSSPQEIIFHWCGVDYFVTMNRFERDSIKITSVDFGDKQIPAKYRENIEKMDEGGYCYIYNTPVVNKDVIALDIMSRDFSACYLYVVKENMVKKGYDEDAWVMTYPSCVDRQGRFIYVMNSPDEYDMFVNNGFPRASAKVEEHIVNGGSVVLYYVTK